MSDEEAGAFLRQAASHYAAGKPGGTLDDDPQRLADSALRKIMGYPEYDI